MIDYDDDDAMILKTMIYVDDARKCLDQPRFLIDIVDRGGCI